MHRRHAAPSPAVVRLADSGGTVAGLAQELGYRGHTAASRYLRGERRAPPGMRDALVRLVGSEAADDVMAAVPRK